VDFGSVYSIERMTGIDPPVRDKCSVTAELEGAVALQRTLNSCSPQRPLPEWLGAKPW